MLLALPVCAGCVQRARGSCRGRPKPANPRCPATTRGCSGKLCKQRQGTVLRGRQRCHLLFRNRRQGAESRLKVLWSMSVLNNDEGADSRRVLPLSTVATALAGLFGEPFSWLSTTEAGHSSSDGEEPARRAAECWPSLPRERGRRRAPSGGWFQCRRSDR